MSDLNKLGAGSNIPGEAQVGGAKNSERIGWHCHVADARQHVLLAFWVADRSEGASVCV